MGRRLPLFADADPATGADMQVDIRRIRVLKRVRKDMGAIGELAASMARFGQLHPVVLTRRYHLVSGHRRLEAAKSLGWTTIEAIMIRGQGKAALLELELDENLQRAQLSADEVADGLARLERLNHPGLLARLWNALVAWFRKLFHIED